MPSPLGHATIGFTAHAFYCKNRSVISSWKVVALVIFLANLPDIDVLVGLIFYNNGGVFHRGPTHSLLFALAMGLVAANLWRFWSAIPKVTFLWCFLLILSHVLADAIFTTQPVSLWWPLEVHPSGGYCGWSDLISSIFRGAFQDIAIVFGFGVFIIINRLFKYGLIRFSLRKPLEATVPKRK